MEENGSNLNPEKGNNVFLNQNFYWTHGRTTLLKPRSQWIQETNISMETWTSTVIFYEIKELQIPHIVQIPCIVQANF